MEAVTETPNRELLTDAEICELFRISIRTLQSWLNEGPPNKRHQDGKDISDIDHFVVGGSRRWVKSSVDEFINRKEEE